MTGISLASYRLQQAQGTRPLSVNRTDRRWLDLTGGAVAGGAAGGAGSLGDVHLWPAQDLQGVKHRPPHHCMVEAVVWQHASAPYARTTLAIDKTVSTLEHLVMCRAGSGSCRVPRWVVPTQSVSPSALRRSTTRAPCNCVCRCVCWHLHLSGLLRLAAIQDDCRLIDRRERKVGIVYQSL